MKLYCLSSDAAKPCFVLSFKELLIMLDCGLSAHSVLSFLPLPPVASPRLAALPAYSPPHRADPLLEGELKECCGRVFVDSVPEFCPPLDKVVDFARLDVILISNYTCMLALPFVTEGTGFKGRVYATEPTLQIGRFYLQELVEWLETGNGGGGQAKRWKELLHVLPPPLAHAQRPRAWRRLFSGAAVARALARVRVVGYDERVDVYGALDATAVSSGFCLGSANWVLRSAHEKVAYVSGSSTLTTHPRPVNQAALRGADLLVLAALTQTPAHNPDHMLGDLCVHCAGTLRAGGCVLLPVYPSGVLYDLLECLSQHLEGAGLAHVPLYCVGPAADAALAYSNILAEWVSAGKAARVPDEPFPHAALQRAQRLRVAPALHDLASSQEFRQPCVVFCGHPSLRFGAAVHLLELWGSNPAHAVIFTEPDFPYVEALAPFQPLQIKAYHCPIDTSLNYSQANKLVRELRPRELALPEQYAPPPPGAPPRPHIAPDAPLLPLRRGGARRTAVRRTAARAHLDAALAAALSPRELRAGLRAAPLRASLRVRDNVMELVAPPEEAGGAGALPAAGAPDVERLVGALAAAGAAGARVERGAEGAIVHLPRHDALLHVERHATHVFCEGGADVRRMLRAALQHALDPHQP